MRVAGLFLLMMMACGSRSALDAPVDAGVTNVAPCTAKRYNLQITSPVFAPDDHDVFVATLEGLFRVDEETGASLTIAVGAFTDVMVDASFAYVTHDSVVSKIPKSGGTATDLAPATGFFVGQTEDDVFLAEGNNVAVVPKNGGPSSFLMSASAAPITAIVAAASDSSRLFWSSGVAIYTAPLDATGTSPTSYGDYPTDFGYALAIDDKYIWTVASHSLMRMSKGGGDVTYEPAGISAPLAAARGSVFGSQNGIARFSNGATTALSPDLPRRLVVQGACLYAVAFVDDYLALERFPIE